jgi:hypothetical protein
MEEGGGRGGVGLQRYSHEMGGCYSTDIIRTKKYKYHRRQSKQRSLKSFLSKNPTAIVCKFEVPSLHIIIFLGRVCTCLYLFLSINASVCTTTDL